MCLSNESNVSGVNTSTCVTTSDEMLEWLPDGILRLLLALFLFLFIVAVLVGNIFVVMSVLLFRDMRTLTNALIVSLASADVLVAVLVLPLSMYNELVRARWALGKVLCDFYISMDVFCCTASILNIVVIAMDRYWLITLNVHYTHSERLSRAGVAGIMVLLAWMLSALIALCPLFVWQHQYEHHNLCQISQHPTYTLFSTLLAFWLPLALIVVVYVKIFSIARRRARAYTRRAALQSHAAASRNALTIGDREADAAALETGTRHHPPLQSECDSGEPTSPEPPPDTPAPAIRRLGSNVRRRQRLRLRHSARTLGLIIGGFVLCWLPFFVVATLSPFCKPCRPEPLLASIALWLGYSNSLINPIIYAISDRNFQRSFRKLAHCQVRWATVF